MRMPSGFRPAGRSFVLPSCNTSTSSFHNSTPSSSMMEETNLPTDISETTETAPTAAAAAGTSGGSSEGLDLAAAPIASSSPQEGSPAAAEEGANATSPGGGDNGDEAARLKATELFGPDDLDDPLLSQQPSSKVRDGDFVLLQFADGKQIFAHCVPSWRGKSAPVKIAKRSYPTANLIGLPYGTVLELGRGGLTPLGDDEDVVPDIEVGGASVVVSRRDSGTSSPVPPSVLGADTGSATATADGTGTGIGAVGGALNLNYAGSTNEHSEENDPEREAEMAAAGYNDNRNLIDNNTAQGISYTAVTEMREQGIHGSEIVAALIENSATFDGKTEFSKAKYIKRKQMKYQPRCRMVRCTGASICEAYFLREPRKIMNLREDTLAQILAYSNVCAGCQVMVYENCMGIITGALAQRMGGYGKIISLYQAQQMSFTEMITRFNLSFAENQSVKWLHTGEVLADDAARPVAPSTGGAGVVEEGSEEVVDYELADREQLVWPCPLQPHTRTYLENMSSDRERADFVAKRCARFARKLTRHTVLEARRWVHDPQRLCSSIILATKYDPTACLLKMLPHLAPSCPFVVYSEFIEPLAECFRELQRQNLAINLRLTDTWYREYQVLPGRTHPNMNMSQSGGFLLTGVKLCPITGKNELDDSVVKALKAQEKGRRGRARKKSKEAKKKRAGGSNESRDTKRLRKKK